MELNKGLGSLSGAGLRIRLLILAQLIQTTASQSKRPRLMKRCVNECRQQEKQQCSTWYHEFNFDACSAVVCLGKLLWMAWLVRLWDCEKWERIQKHVESLPLQAHWPESAEPSATDPKVPNLTQRTVWFNLNTCYMLIYKKLLIGLLLQIGNHKFSRCTNFKLKHADLLGTHSFRNNANMCGRKLTENRSPESARFYSLIAVL